MRYQNSEEEQMDEEQLYSKISIERVAVNRRQL